MGADEVIDYRKTPFETVVKHYDVVLDPMSYLYEETTFAAASSVLRPDGGHYLNILGSAWALDSEGREKGNGFLTALQFLHHRAASVLRLAGVSTEKLKNWGFPSTRYDVVFVNPSGEDLARSKIALGGGIVSFLFRLLFAPISLSSFLSLSLLFSFFLFLPPFGMAFF